jgi:nucleotide-binding universal stress UspA family protein
MDIDAAPESGELHAGQHVGGFMLDGLLHAGNRSTLWRVSKLDDDAAAPLVMKLPRDDDSVAFEVEQMILPTLAGPHAPRFVAAGSAPRPYVVMQHIAGTWLHEVARNAPLPPQQVADIGAGVAIALHALHRQQVVHLNVAAENIVLRDSGEAVLVDFGCARHERLPDLLDDGSGAPPAGPTHMPPEQAGGARCDPRSDLFALGVLLYRLCTGVTPFDAADDARGLRWRWYRDIVAPRALRADCPPWLQEAILRCLEADPDRRPASAAQLAFDLRHAQQMALTSRAYRVTRSDLLTRAHQWLAAQVARRVSARSASSQLARGPIVLAAVDLAGAQPQAVDALCRTAQFMLEHMPAARLACLAVHEADGLRIDELIDADGTHKSARLLMQLRQWARPLLHAPQHEAARQAGRVTLHVLEARDAAAAIVDFAHRNLVDHIVLGADSAAPATGKRRGAAARVIAEADCSVTLVRAAGGA